MRRPALLMIIAEILSVSTLLFWMAPPAQADPPIIQATATPLSQTDAATHLANGITALTETLDTPLAYAELNAAIAADPALWEAYYWRTQLYYDVGALDLALADVNVVLENEPDNVEALILRAQVYNGPFRMDMPYFIGNLEFTGHWGYGRDYDLATDTLREAIPYDNTSLVLVAYGDAVAADWYNARFSPDTTSVEDVEYIREQAIMMYNTMLELEEDHVEAIFHSGLLAMAPLRLAADYQPDKIDFFTTNLSRVTLLAPDSLYATYAKALLYRVNGDLPQAILEVQAAIERFPNYAPLHHWLMMFTNALLSGERPNPDSRALAQQSANQAVALAPYSPLYLLNATNQIESRPEYIRALEHILTLDADYPPALNRLAYAYVHEGADQDCAAAAEYATRYLASNLETDVAELFSFDFDVNYTRLCTAATPTPIFIPVTNGRYAVGDTLTLPGFGIFSIKESPHLRESTILCTAGTAATVLQVIQLEAGTVIYVQLECDAGVGWIEETLLP